MFVSYETTSTAAGNEIRAIRSSVSPPQVVFLHGVGARADRWRPNFEMCAQLGYSAVALDFPGHGYSSKGADANYTVTGLAEVVRGVLESCEVSEPVTMVGTSLGAHVAAHLALHCPELVARLVLVGPIGLLPLGPEASGRLADALVDTSKEGIEAKLRALIYDDQHLVTSDWIEEEWRINNSPGAAEAFRALASYLRSGIDADAVGEGLRATRPQLPCLLVWGVEDAIVPIALMDATRAILPPSTRCLAIQRAGHAPYLENPEEFGAALRAFLSEAGVAS